MSSSTDYVATGGFDVVALPTGIQPSGFRIIPVLAAGSTWAALVAAYATLKARVVKQTQNFPSSVTEDQYVPGPDWVRSPGFGALSFQGVAGITYRIWLATDCKEMVDAVSPAMTGFGGAAAGGGSVTTTTTTVNFTATAPSAVGDGVSIAGARAIKASWKAANAGATLNAAGSVKGYGLNGASRWVRIPELDYVPTEAVVEPMEFGMAPQPVLFGISRVAYVPSGLTASAGTQVVQTIEVLT
jgi:hypothetical protein